MQVSSLCRASPPCICRTRRQPLTFHENKRSATCKAAEGVPSIFYHEGTSLNQPFEETSRPVFYTHTQCPYTHRVWMTLVEKVLVKEMISAEVEIDLSNKPSWYSSINPHAMVPALTYKDRIYVESIDICRYIASEWKSSVLHSSQKAEAQRTEELLTKTDRLVTAGLVEVGGGMPWSIELSASRWDNNRDSTFYRQLQELDNYISYHQGPFLTGSQPTLADIALYPFYWRFMLILKAFRGFSLQKHKNVTNWIEAMNERTSARMTNPDEDMLLSAYRKYRSLDFFNYHSISALQLYPHLSKQ